MAAVGDEHADMSLVTITREIAKELPALRFSAPVAFVYDPLDYAFDVHRRWLERFGAGPKEILLLGMNPGPFGMVQTGVPFGEVEAVRSWLGLHGVVKQPAKAHPRRPVLGFDCPRSEVSGRRLWQFLARRFVTPQRCFRRLFVHNYCPLAFCDAHGGNLTPEKLAKAESEPLFRLCDRFLREVAAAIRPRLVVGVGVFAAERARRALAETGVAIGGIPHPSPASPAANRGWERMAAAAFAELGVAI
jgi:single-strand selective monofunctional uracil DNA glycosylase